MFSYLSSYLPAVLLLQGYELGSVDASLSHGGRGGIEGGPGDGEDAVELVAVVGEGDSDASSIGCDGEREEEGGAFLTGGRESTHLPVDGGTEEVLRGDIWLQLSLHEDLHTHGLLEGGVEGRLPVGTLIGALGDDLLARGVGVVGVGGAGEEEEEGKEKEETTPSPS